MDLGTLRSEWHPSLNDLDFDEVSRGDQTKAWWICSRGHEWQAIFGNRAKGRGCPFCANKAVLAGFNDLATTHPDLAAEWHPTRNGALTAREVVAGTNKQVWWRASCGHEWEAAGATRLRGSGCPYCANRTVLVGFNDLTTTHPDLAEQWHPTKNGDLAPRDITAGTTRRAWWLGACAHEWAGAVAHRSRGVGCPFCANKAVLAGFNDLATTHPDLAAEWHPTRNGDLGPSQVVAGSGKKAWWLGACAHEWTATLSKRAAGRGCPFCASKAVLAGFNDLATTHPDLAAEWHPAKNDALTAHEVSAGSHAMAWWRCGAEHEWRGSVVNRTKGRGCPYCANKVVLAGFNDLATTHPDLAAQWHPTKNGDLAPAQVTYGADLRAWWSGTCGHEWVAVVFDRTRRGRPTGCPACANHVSAPEANVAAVVMALCPDVEMERTQNIAGTKMSVDLLVTEKRLAIEFNGVYWHSEANGRSQETHTVKARTLRSRAIDLHVIWSDDWADLARRVVVVRGLAHRLGATARLAEGLAAAGIEVASPLVAEWCARYPARSLIPETTPSAEGQDFLSTNHIQGSSRVVTHYGLRDRTGTLRAVLGVRARKDGVWEIVRYATSGTVQGGFTRLLAHAERQIRTHDRPITGWVTFSDHSISAGSLYAAHGFSADAEVPSDYSYMIPDRFGGHREHKFNYRVGTFRSRADLQDQDGMSERELAALNGLVRVWDYGKTRWFRPAGKASA